MDLRTELNKYLNKVNVMTTFNNHQLNLVLFDYKDKQIIKLLNEWKICLSYMGKGHLFKDNYVVEIIFCLLSDYQYVHSINNKESPLHLYNPLLNELTNLVVVDKNRNIKFKLFNVSNTLIVIDFKQDHYKIYKLYGIYLIKEYYNSKEINFDRLIKELFIKPFFEGNLDNIENDYAKLSYINYTKKDIIETRFNTIMHYYHVNKKLDQKFDEEYKLSIKKILHDWNIINRSNRTHIERH